MKTAKHAISRICSMIFGKTCGAYVLKFCEHESLNRELQYANPLHFGDFLRQSLGAHLLILSVPGGYHFKNLKNAILHAFFNVLS